MLKRIWRNSPEQRNLPWLVNGSLPPAQRRSVELWLASRQSSQDERPAWELLRDTLRSQSEGSPDPLVLGRLMSTIRQETAQRVARPQFTPRLALSGFALAVSIMILLWLLIQPGMVLQWSQDADVVTSYRVYRAPQGGSHYDLVEEIPVSPKVHQYTYVDARVAPGGDYIYRIEALNASGVQLPSQQVVGRWAELLPGWLALIVASLILGYLIAFWLDRSMRRPLVLAM